MERGPLFRCAMAGLFALAQAACTTPITMRAAAWYNIDTPVPYTVQSGGYAAQDGDAAGNGTTACRSICARPSRLSSSFRTAIVSIRARSRRVI